MVKNEGLYMQVLQERMDNFQMRLSYQKGLKNEEGITQKDSNSRYNKVVNKWRVRGATW